MPTTVIPPPPTESDPASPPNRRFSPEEIRLLVEMMQRPEVKGNLAAAVALLQHEQPNTDWNYQRCYKLTRTNAYLNAFSGARNPEGLVPQPDGMIDRERPEEPLTPSEQRELSQLVNQNKLLKQQDWRELGLSEVQSKRMVSMEAFARRPLKSIVDATHGSMIFTLGHLLHNFEETMKRIADGSLPEEHDREGNPRPQIDVERDWHMVALAYSREIRAIKDQVDRGVLLAAKVAQMQGAGKGKRGGKPGFAPMTINAQPGSTVKVEAKSEDDE
jgi:hypothetical protein